MFSLDWESKVKILHTILFIIFKETINISIWMDNYLFKQVPFLVTPLEEQFLDHFQAIVICNWDNIVPLCFDSRSPKMNMHGQKWIRQNILKRHILKCSSKDRKTKSLGKQIYVVIVMFTLFLNCMDVLSIVQILKLFSFCDWNFSAFQLILS